MSLDEFAPPRTGRNANPLDWQSPEDWVWTTVNTSETLVGVLMPLSWAYWEEAIEDGMRRCFHDFGVLSAREVTDPPQNEERFTAVFAGRYAASINAMRKIGDRMLGTDGDAVEEQILGGISSGIPRQNSIRRYPIILAKMPRVAIGLPKRLDAARRATDAWWKEQTDPAIVADLDGAADRLVAARRRFQDLMRIHAASTMLAQAAYDQVKQLSEGAGFEGLERRLVTGYGNFEEAHIAADLWSVPRDRLSMDEFISRHGYHGPREGTIDSRSWRQDRTPLLSLIKTYKEMPDSDDPVDSEQARLDERIAAEEALYGALGRAARPRAKAILGFARRHVPLREVSKAAFLQAIDAGRAAAHADGEWLAKGGHLDDPQDVFFLDLPDVASRRTEGLRTIVEERRAERNHWQELYLPDSWAGIPEPITLASRDDGEGEVAGIAVSSGVVEGLVRLILNLEEDDIEPGEILVCETTDPSWASWFLVASALVIDVGGVMSHGAIVAREMGVPCVINTRNGTRRLRTGDRVRVDGDAGTVTVLERA